MYYCTLYDVNNWSFCSQFSILLNMFCQLSALLSDIGLNIREAHVFSTHDGYSLDVFVVDGWLVEVTC
jgi:hypothetical protein